MNADTLKMKPNINVALKDIKDYAKIAISVDCVIFGYNGNQLKILVLESDMPPYKTQLSLIGDMVDVDEDLDQAALRILKERVGFTDVYLEQVMAFGKLNRHPLGRVITVSYYSLISMSDHEPSSVLPLPAKWVDIYSIKNMAFDHIEILHAALDQLRKSVRFNPIGFNLLPAEFTLSQLQNLYESIMNQSLDKRNFRKKITAMGFLTDCHKNQIQVAHRPARLFKFDLEKYHALEASGFVFEIS